MWLPRNGRDLSCHVEFDGELAETGRGDVGSWEEYWDRYGLLRAEGGVRGLYSS